MKVQKWVLVALTSTFVATAQAQSTQSNNASENKDEQTFQEKAQQASEEIISHYRSSGVRAAESRGKNDMTLLMHYSPLDLLITSKMGATLAWHKEANRIYELEYLRASISAPSYVVSDVASMSETRVTLQKRNFNGGTFNWFWGLAYNSSNVHVSPQLMASVGQPGVSDLLDVQTLGLNFGFGNRWVFKEKFSLGVDWFSWSQPLVTLKKSASYLDSSSSSSDRDTVDDLLNVVAFFPRWTALKVSVGYSF